MPNLDPWVNQINNDYEDTATKTINKFEKEKKVIELHQEGKTYKEIVIEVHKNFRDIAKIIKTYERKKELQAKREECNKSTQPKKPSKSISL